MAIPVSLADLNAYTSSYFAPAARNVVFKESPVLVRLLSRGQIFPGGVDIKEPIIYAELNGGPFAKTDTFNISYVQTEAAFRVVPKFYQVTITLYGPDAVLNRGPQAVFSIVDMKFANAAMKMAKAIASDLYRDGQSSSADVAASGGLLSTPISLDGLLAWVDDGNNSGTYPTATNLTRSFDSVGGLTRADLLATTPTFTGPETPVSALGGANAYVHRNVSTFSLAAINKAMTYARYGRQYVDLLVVNNATWHNIWNSTIPYQRFNEESSDLAKVGMKAFRFNEADVVIDHYMPSGICFGLNTKSIKLYVSADEKYRFGFTGFKTAQNNDNLTGQFLAAVALTVPNPRFNFKLIGDAFA